MEDAEALLAAERLKQLAEARSRLDWLLDEYGEGDIDYQSFAPIVEALEALLAEPVGRV